MCNGWITPAARPVGRQTMCLFEAEAGRIAAGVAVAFVIELVS